MNDYIPPFNITNKMLDLVASIMEKIGRLDNYNNLNKMPILRRNNKTKTEVSIDEPLNVDWEGNELLLSDILGTDVDVIYKDIEEEVDKSLLRKAIEKLTQREQKIISLRFGIGNKNNVDCEKTQKEVADMLGISQSYISRLEKKIIKRLKKEIGKMI